MGCNILTLLPLQGFSSRETNFHFCQFLSNFLRYSLSNFLLLHPYNIFTVYFSSNSSYLKSHSSATFNLSYFVTFAFILFLKSATTSLVFPKSSFLPHVLCLAVNPFQHTKYFIIPLIFCLFDILLTFHFSFLSTSTDSHYNWQF